MPLYSIIYSFPYILFFIYTYGLNFSVGIKKNTKSYDIKLGLLFIGSVIFLGLRGFIYTDWSSYYIFFERLPTLADLFANVELLKNEYMEKGFVIYSIILKSISPNYFFYQCYSFIIDYVILYFFFKQYIPNQIILGFVMYYIFGGLIISIDLLRNAKSILLFLVSIKYCGKRRFVPYVLLNVFGSFFHITSLLYIPLYFVLRRNISKIFILFIFIIGNIFFLLQIQWIKKILVIIFVFVNNRLGELIKIYLQSDVHSNAYGITIGYIERQFSFIVVYCFSSYLKKISSYNNIFINIFYFYTFIFLFCSEMEILLGRVALIFIMGYWLLYPQIYSVLSKNKKYIFVLLLSTYSILKLISAHSFVIYYYDNALLSPKTFENRNTILQHYFKSGIRIKK
jgi:hypothetical protein